MLTLNIYLPSHDQLYSYKQLLPTLWMATSSTAVPLYSTSYSSPRLPAQRATAAGNSRLGEIDIGPRHYPQRNKEGKRRAREQKNQILVRLHSCNAFRGVDRRRSTVPSIDCLGLPVEYSIA